MGANSLPQTLPLSVGYIQQQLSSAGKPAEGPLWGPGVLGCEPMFVFTLSSCFCVCVCFYGLRHNDVVS